jgi:dihydrofolate reductase
MTDRFRAMQCRSWLTCWSTPSAQGSRTKNCIVTRPRTSPRPMPSFFGRVTYEMMEAAFRPPAGTGVRPDSREPFARTMDAKKEYVVSRTMVRVDWNAELVRGDLGKAVQQLKRESGKGLLVGGVKLPLALAELGLIDEYEFLAQPRLAGHGPTLFAGLSKRVDVKLVSRLEFGSGVVAMRYQPRR